MERTNCFTCTHNNVCINFKVADVVECRDYQPICKACNHWDEINFDGIGDCAYMIYKTDSDDSCTLGEPRKDK